MLTLKVEGGATSHEKWALEAQGKGKEVDSPLRSEGRREGEKEQTPSNTFNF